ncbi:MAG: methyltransferase domain-containing protein [Verrucomicrobia bacterium]|nr:methyltransferase domain-containing protein [Verrucomicrobiota bacterium]
MSIPSSPRASHEIEHGKKLAQGDPELVWGWGTPAGRQRAQRRAELIASAAGLKPGSRTLEVGCGTGMFTEIFARTGARIVAVDISPELLELARERGLPADRVQFIQKGFEDCEAEGPFDAVIGSSILHHLDMEVSMRKILRLLKPGGCISFAEPNMLNPQLALQKNVPWLKARMGDSPDETAFVRWRLAALLRRVGFVGISLRPFDWLHPSTPQRLVGLVSRLGAILERVPLLRELAGSVHIFARRPPA